MSKIHYFQRYSSIENTVTNNTLQLFARIYEYSASAASSLLSDITGESVEIGIEINQQQRAGNAIPDGAIIQRSFKILIEAKVDAGYDVDQLLRHAAAFTSESQKLLLLLTKQSIGSAEQDIAHRIRQRSPDVIFKNITYERICEAVIGRFKEYEATMSALVDDYVEYCNDVNLFDQSRFLLRIVPCGESVAINKKYGIYFHSSDRGYTQHAFIGIYANKTVQSVWALESVFDAELRDGTLFKTLVQGEDTNTYDQRLIDIIKDAKDVCGYEIASGHRFFCGNPADTDFRKSSPGGIQGARFVNLRDTIGAFSNASDVAAKLRVKTWE